MHPSTEGNVHCTSFVFANACRVYWQAMWSNPENGFRNCSRNWIVTQLTLLAKTGTPPRRTHERVYTIVNICYGFNYSRGWRKKGAIVKQAHYCVVFSEPILMYLTCVHCGCLLKSRLVLHPVWRWLGEPSWNRRITALTGRNQPLPRQI